MSTTLTPTGVKFPDGTTQTTAVTLLNSNNYPSTSTSEATTPAYVSAALTSTSSSAGVIASLVNLDDHGITTPGPLPASGTWFSTTINTALSIICFPVISSTGPTNQWFIATSGDYVQIRDNNGTWYNSTIIPQGRSFNLPAGTRPVQVARYSYLTDPQNVSVQMSGSTG